MEEVPCIHCGTFFIPRNRKQNYFSFPECQKARRAAWQRNKLQTDREYRENQRISNKKWIQNNPGYWKEYRRNNPDKADRNRTLQKVRNNRRLSPATHSTTSKPNLIAKMDARKSSDGKLSGQYWLVPLFAKMDAIKIYLHVITDSYK